MGGGGGGGGGHVGMISDMASYDQEPNVGYGDR